MVIVGLTLFFSSVSLSESKAVVSVKVDTGIGLAAEVRMDVHVRSLVEKHSVFKVIFFDIGQAVHIDCWDDIVFVLD